MKRIEAFLPPHRLGIVVHRLHELRRFPGLTLVNAQGQGHGRGKGGHYAYDEASLMYLDRKILIIFCEDSETAAIVELIAGVSHTGNRGDGIVVVSDVSQMVRIRTSPAGREALTADPDVSGLGAPKSPPDEAGGLS
ncbi:MAG: P-II family nitrogen regulator [Proteobacteria bacterium]|nr:P-II family nitrogen regulator [Pseudomonadota bacterium]